MGMFITCGQLTIAIRQHTRDSNNEPQPAVEHAGPQGNERAGVGCAVIESGRLHMDSMEFARQVNVMLQAMTDEQWWAHQFLIHPNVFAFVHHRLQ